MLTSTEAEIAKIIQGNLPAARRPFLEVAHLARLSEGEVIETVSHLLEKGVLRKFCAILRHQKAGWERNAMVVWSVPDGRQEFVGTMLASFPEVTHCYERDPPFLGRYNIFTMIHLRDNQDNLFMSKIANAMGVNDYLALESVQEFKKTSMEYY